jgi:hypothetical protein
VKSTARTHLIAAVTTAVGALALSSPRRLSRLAAGSAAAVPPAWIVRLLGIRYLMQAAAEFARPTRTVWRASSAIDDLHAATMVAAAFTWPSYRRLALASGVLATGSAAATYSAARRL